MLSKLENQFSITRAALTTSGRAKSKFLLVKMNLFHGTAALALLGFLACAGILDARAGQFDITGPAGSSFGTSVTVLPNGNFVVTDPGYDAPGPITNVGAVYLYDGVTFAVISTLTGSTANDQVGSESVTVLSNGNYVVRSISWNGTRGAVTWGSGTSGVTGAVSAANSLVGTTPGDHVGISVTPLTNGNYVVRNTAWNGSRGAVTWGSGTTGIAGAVSAANSLVGSAAYDQVGSAGVSVLDNGNYVVRSPFWHNGAVTDAGAATLGSGTSGITGAVSAANSLVGTTAGDQVGAGLSVLANGNYILFSKSWNGLRGAVTWGSGTTAVTGAVSAANSLVGRTASDQIGYGLTLLANGNYVVRSPYWDNGAVTDVGAATWGSGTTGVTGAVLAANSLVGTTAGDNVGSGVGALANGNYVVSSQYWDNGALANAGAVTWGSGTTGMTGAVSAANSLVGSATSDQVGFSVTPLANGNYVVGSPAWNDGRGAATWGSGTSGVTGTVTAANSLVGSTADDIVGFVVTALPNGDYVVYSSGWDNGAVTDAGAATWHNGTSGVTGAVSAANSVLGTAGEGGGSMNFAYDPLNTRFLVGYPADSHVSVFGYAPKIVVQQPLNVNLANGATSISGAPAGTNASLTFTIKNINVGDLTGLGITIDGPDAALFTVTASPTVPVSGPFGSTTFTVRFAPATTGAKTAALHIASNDSHQNPFDINLSGQVLSFTQDTDGDGLSDAAEFNLSALGFDWQVSQASLVSSLLANANGAGLYTTNQVQALNVGIPLLIRDPQTGQFTLTIAVQKSTNLVDGSFAPFPMSAPQTTINAQGELEFRFTVPDNAAFFRLESK